jgi:hypothetical protein
LDWSTTEWPASLIPIHVLPPCDLCIAHALATTNPWPPCCHPSPAATTPQEKAEQERLEALEKAAEAAKKEKEEQEQQANEQEVEDMQQEGIQGDDLTALAAVSHVAREVGGGAAGVLLKREEAPSEMCLD